MLWVGETQVDVIVIIKAICVRNSYHIRTYVYGTDVTLRY